MVDRLTGSSKAQSKRKSPAANPAINSERSRVGPAQPESNPGGRSADPLRPARSVYASPFNTSGGRRYRETHFVATSPWRSESTRNHRSSSVSWRNCHSSAHDPSIPSGLDSCYQRCHRNSVQRTGSFQRSLASGRPIERGRLEGQSKPPFPICRHFQVNRRRRHLRQGTHRCDAQSARNGYCRVGDGD